MADYHRFAHQKICCEDAEGVIGLCKRNRRSFCGETKIEILTLSEDQKWAEEPVTIDINELRAEEWPLWRDLPSIYPFSPY